MTDVSALAMDDDERGEEGTLDEEEGKEGMEFDRCEHCIVIIISRSTKAPLTIVTKRRLWNAIVVCISRGVIVVTVI